MPPSSSPTTTKKEFQAPGKSTATLNKDLNPDRLKMAKEEADRAIKVRNRPFNLFFLTQKILKNNFFS
jgi:hypothetical protein